MELSNDIREQIKEAFRTMAEELGMHPPSDADANDFAKEWWREEDNLTFKIGCANFSTRKATIYAIEAARHMCAGTHGDAAAIKLLRLALAEMGRVVRPK